MDAYRSLIGEGREDLRDQALVASWPRCLCGGIKEGTMPSRTQRDEDKLESRRSNLSQNRDRNEQSVLPKALASWDLPFGDAVVPYRSYYPGTQPDHLHAPYASSIHRAPTQPLIKLPQTVSESTGPIFSASLVSAATADLTRQHAGEPIGERIVVSGRVLDENGRPVRNTLVEVWQANACGRYRHDGDQHDAPLDANFTGAGRVVTDEMGYYQFKTIKPGSYPWRNHYNAWRPAHIHFSLLGPAFITRLVTQMYFPGDPLLPFDPIFNCTADEKARNRLISSFDWEKVVPDTNLAYKFDIVLRGRNETPFEV
jgi:protocatechuate 3,4-dioxygenase beta subunit